ncbi:MAG: hypothetical protein JXB05_37775 [Myxococcaceae bacterium]|nr:hypothetical protein [Myxococcaceae bacterium]
MSQKPSIGRIVHFVMPAIPSINKPPESHAALVTGVNDDGTVSLTAFPPGKMAYTVENASEGPDAAGTGGHWTWPPRT